MQCNEARRMMSERLDDRLNANEVQELDRHVLSCLACQSEWQALRTVDTLLTAASVILMPAPADLRARVEERLESQQKARRTLVGTLILLQCTSALLLLILGPLFLRLLDVLWALAPLAAGGLKTAAQLLTYWRTVIQTVLGLLSQFALPLAFLGLAALAVAVGASFSWIEALRRLRIAQRT